MLVTSFTSLIFLHSSTAFELSTLPVIKTLLNTLTNKHENQRTKTIEFMAHLSTFDAIRNLFLYWMFLQNKIK